MSPNGLAFGETLGCVDKPNPDPDAAELRELLKPEADLQALNDDLAERLFTGRSRTPRHVALHVAPTTGVLTGPRLCFAVRN
jgi:hypothetical protein